MERKTIIYTCDWCGKVLLPHDNQVTFGNIDLCERCVGLRDCGDIVSRGIAQGKAPKDAIQEILKNYE